DPPSLDTAIQHALAGLYPPFEATAPTVLAQVFRLLDSDFHGDGLHFLLDFLIPAKRLCERVREAACAPYAHCLFLHEGWPLCLRDEVVVHLAPLNPLLLRQGDFYLQVEPQEEQAVCIMVKCLTSDLRTVDAKPVPASSYPTLFTQAWLEAINSDFEGSPLHNCLVASEDGVAPVPWTKITSPEFVDDRPQAPNALSPAWGSLQLEALDLSCPQELQQGRPLGGQELLARSLTKGRSRTYGNKYPGLIKVEQGTPGEVAFSLDAVVSQDLEGEYVALLDFSQESRGRSPRGEVETSSACPVGALKLLHGTKESPVSQRTRPSSGAPGKPSTEKESCWKAASSEEALLGLRRKDTQKAPAHDSELQPQEPCLSALENPTRCSCTSGLETSVLEAPAVSVMQGPLGDPDNVAQLRPGPQHTSPPGLCPASPVPEAAVEEKPDEGNGRLSKPMAGPSPSTSSRPPTPVLRFSLWRGQKQAPECPERASLPQEGPCPALCSSKVDRAKRLGRGKMTPAQLDKGAALEMHRAARWHWESGRDRWTGSVSGIERPGWHSVERFKVLTASIISPPGSRDRTGRPLLLVSTKEEAWGAPWCTPTEVTKLFSYLCTIPRSEDTTRGLAVVIDARKQRPKPGLLSAFQATQALLPASIHALLFLGEKEAALELEKLPAIQVEVLTSLKTLSHHVDPSQLPRALEGSFPYCHGEWVQFFQKLDPFLADLRQASSLLQASIKEFEKGNPPGGVQEASRCLSKSKELMEAVLRDPGLLRLQREGGATLARLQQEASKLDSNPDIRSHLAEATALYSLVDEQLHVLVTASNHLLGRLELRIRLGRLEAAIHQVSSWMEQEGSRCLQVLMLKDRSLETVEKAHAEFEDFFLQAAAQYRCGLELSKQAAQLGAAAGGTGEAGGTGFPELATFAATQRAFQAKLTHFYMAAERQRTDLETLLHLYHFCKKMTWFHMDCQDLLAQLSLGKAQRASPGDQRRLHRYLQRLASEFPAEKLAAMGLQVASLSRPDLGQDLWEEARARHEEIQTLLKKASAHCPCPAGPTAHSALLQLRGAAAKSQGWSRDVSSRGWQDLPPQDSPGLNRSPKPCWPPPAPRAGPNRRLQGVPRLESSQAAGAGEASAPQEALGLAPERFLPTVFSWQRFPRQSPHPTGGSFSSEGTDSQTSLEDSPHTSPPASL
ncbi:hypothetical protein J0S82_020500, partial [Galemys pyrenaicus]